MAIRLFASLARTTRKPNPSRPDPEPAIQLVMHILKKHSPVGLAAAEILSEGLTLQPPGPPAPSPPPRFRTKKGRIHIPMKQALDHPLRSMHYLKSVILPQLVHRKWVEKKFVAAELVALSEPERERFVAALSAAERAQILQGKEYSALRPKVWRWCLWGTEPVASARPFIGRPTPSSPKSEPPADEGNDL